MRFWSSRALAAVMHLAVSPSSSVFGNTTGDDFGSYVSPCVEIARLVANGGSPLYAMLSAAQKKPELFGLTENALYQAHFGVQPGQIYVSQPTHLDQGSEKGREINQNILRELFKEPMFSGVASLKVVLDQQTELFSIDGGLDQLGKKYRKIFESGFIHATKFVGRLHSLSQSDSDLSSANAHLWKAHFESASEPLRSLYRFTPPGENLNEIEHPGVSTLKSQLISQGQELEKEILDYISVHLADEYRSSSRMWETSKLGGALVLTPLMLLGFGLYASENQMFLRADLLIGLSAAATIGFAYQASRSPESLFKYWRNIFRFMGLAKIFPSLHTSFSKDLKDADRFLRENTFFLSEESKEKRPSSYGEILIREVFAAQDENDKISVRPKYQDVRIAPSDVWGEISLPGAPDLASSALTLQWWDLLNPSKEMIEGEHGQDMWEILQSFVSDPTFAVGITTLEDQVQGLLENGIPLNPLHILYAFSLEKTMIAQLINYMKLAEESPGLLESSYEDKERFVSVENETLLLQNYLKKVPDSYQRILNQIAREEVALQQFLLKTSRELTRKQVRGKLDQLQMLKVVLDSKKKDIQDLSRFIEHLQK